MKNLVILLLIVVALVSFGCEEKKKGANDREKNIFAELPNDILKLSVILPSLPEEVEIPLFQDDMLVEFHSSHLPNETNASWYLFGEDAGFSSTTSTDNYVSRIWKGGKKVSVPQGGHYHSILVYFLDKNAEGYRGQLFWMFEIDKQIRQSTSQLVGAGSKEKIIGEIPRMLTIPGFSNKMHVIWHLEGNPTKAGENWWQPRGKLLHNLQKGEVSTVKTVWAGKDFLEIPEKGWSKMTILVIDPEKKKVVWSFEADRLAKSHLTAWGSDQ